MSAVDKVKVVQELEHLMCKFQCTCGQYTMFLCVCYVLTVAQSLVSKVEMNVEGQCASLSLHEPSDAAFTRQDRGLSGDAIETNTLKIWGLDKTMNKEILQVVFQSRNLGGGPIENIEHDATSGTALITFMEAEGTLSKQPRNK